jgi:hypothetical protein
MSHPQQNGRNDGFLIGVLEHGFYFPYIGKNHPNWRTHIFQRGWYTYHQPVLDGLGDL